MTFMKEVGRDCGKGVDFRPLLSTDVLIVITSWLISVDKGGRSRSSSSTLPSARLFLFYFSNSTYIGSNYSADKHRLDLIRGKAQLNSAILHSERFSHLLQCIGEADLLARIRPL